MMRQSSSRNQRIKKMKMKYALQLLILLAISIWLLYQLKHTFEKKNSLNEKTGNLEESPNTINEIILPEKITKLGRKDLTENVENKGDIEIDEEEEKDTELEQLLEGERTGEEEYGVNGEEDEDIQMDNKEERDVNSSVELIISNKNDTNFGLEDNSKGFITDESISLESSINQENYNNTTENFELHGNAIERNSSQASNGTAYLSARVESSENEATKKE